MYKHIIKYRYKTSSSSISPVQRLEVVIQDRIYYDGPGKWKEKCLNLIQSNTGISASSVLTDSLFGLEVNGGEPVGTSSETNSSTNSNYKSPSQVNREWKQDMKQKDREFNEWAAQLQAERDRKRGKVSNNEPKEDKIKDMFDNMSKEKAEVESDSKPLESLKKSWKLLVVFVIICIAAVFLIPKKSKKIKNIDNSLNSSIESNNSTVGDNEKHYRIQDADGYTNLRNSPNGEIVRKVYENERFQIIGTEGKFKKVQFSDGSTGYIHQSRIALVE